MLKLMARLGLALGAALPLAARAQAPTPAPTAAQAPEPAAAQPADRQARLWVAGCAGCHGTNGLSRGGIPSIAGRPAPQNLQALHEFRADQRPASTVMHQHAKGYTEDELQRIVRLLETLPAQ